MIISFTIDNGDIKLDNTDCTQANVASIAAYCIIALAQANKALPDDVVADLLKICKGAIKNDI